MAKSECGNGFDWSQLKGMQLAQAEQFMLEILGCIPDEWDDPLFRDEVLGLSGASAVDGNLDLGELGYRNRLGDDARTIIYQRNVDGQGMPGFE